MKNKQISPVTQKEFREHIKKHWPEYAAEKGWVPNPKESKTEKEAKRLEFIAKVQKAVPKNAYKRFGYAVKVCNELSDELELDLHIVQEDEKYRVIAPDPNKGPATQCPLSPNFVPGETFWTVEEGTGFVVIHTGYQVEPIGWYDKKAGFAYMDQDEDEE